jgi:hypothetical protein
MSSREERRKDWEDLIANWRKSGKPMAAYCRERKIVYRQFIRWRHRIERAARPKSLTLIPVATPTEKRNPLVIRLPDGIGVEVAHGFDAALLNAVIRTLKEASRC